MQSQSFSDDVSCVVSNIDSLNVEEEELLSSFSEDDYFDTEENGLQLGFFGNALFGLLNFPKSY